MRSRIVLTVGVMLLCSLVVSCGLFQTRDPQSPTQTSSTFTPPSDPSIVFDNLRNSLSELNSLNYVRCLSDSTTTGRSFVFEPTTQARGRYGGVLSSWGRQNEQVYFDNVKSKLQPGTSISLELQTETPISVQPDSAQYEFIYRLTVPHTVASVAKQVKGKAQMFLIASPARLWYIQRWIDVGLTTTDTTWSDIKGAFGQ